MRNGDVLRTTDIGFDTHPLTSIRSTGTGSTSDLVSQAYDAFKTGALTAGVSVTSANPLTGELPMSPVRKSRGDRITAMTYMFVSPDYFATVQVPIVAGRGFQPDEARTEAKVAIISASAAQALWPGEDPLGRTLRFWMPPEDRPDVMTHDRLVSSAQVDVEGDEVVVVGVANDVVSGLVYDGRRPHLYLPTSPGTRHAKALIVRGQSIQGVRSDKLQAVLRTVDPNPLAFTTLPLDEALTLQTYPMTIASWIGVLLSAIALALSVSGLYGVVTYGLSQRTKEIGIRISLGASSAAIIRLVMSQAGRLVAIGSALGLIVSFSALGVLAAIVPLKNVSILNGTSFSVGTLIVALATASAAYLPSRRATRIDPSQSLRADQ